ncbi:MAG: cbb3-type cytochrome c oxidase subunit II [Acidimicrobiia bacterium]
MTADTSTIEPQPVGSTTAASTIATRFFAAATGFFVLGLIVACVAAVQGVLPDLLSGRAQTSIGRLAPASRWLLFDGWIITGLLGGSFFAISRSFGVEVARKALATASLLLIVVGTLAGGFGIIFGLQSGIAGFDAPLWARGITVAGFVLAAISLSATAGAARSKLGTTGWYLTAAAWWLALSGAVSLVPPMSGMGGAIQTSFASATVTGLFVITASVGLMYFAATTLTGTDPSVPRPLGAIGFWSLAIVWGSMGATELIFSGAPDWYETLGVGFAIASFVPLLAIATDLGLMLKGTVSRIADRASLRYATVAFVSFAVFTVTNFLLTYRSTSAIIHWTSATQAGRILVTLGIGSFALFATHSIMRGGNRSGAPMHFSWSVAGLTGVVFGTLAGGVVAGFSWASGPASGSFANVGSAWEITAVSVEPFMWITAGSLILFTVAQVLYAVVWGRKASDEVLPPAFGALDYDLEFEGAVLAPSFKRLAWGAAAVWIVAALMTGMFPAVDPDNSDSTILGDQSRNYPAGSVELAGRNLYISEGCAECHTQSVRPVGTDVGLGPVSIAGDYVHESPTLLGVARIGPDLMHTASSDEFNAGFLRSHLADPRVSRPWSTMPSYSYLSDEDMNALISYIETLR